MFLGSYERCILQLGKELFAERAKISTVCLITLGLKANTNYSIGSKGDKSTFHAVF